MSVLLLIQFIDVINENGKKFNSEDCQVVYPREKYIYELGDQSEKTKENKSVWLTR